MKRGKYAFHIALWIIVLAVLIGILINVNGSFSLFRTSQIRSTALKYTNEYEVELLNDEKIEFDLTVDDVVLDYYEGNSIKITEKCNYELKENETLKIDRKSDSLLISRGEYKFNNKRMSINRLLQVYLPKEYKGKLEISNNVGDISINSELILNELKTKQNVGDLRITFMDTNRYEIENNVGDIDIKNISGYGEISSDVGDINCSIESIKGNIKLKANTGKIKVLVNSNSSFNLDASYGIGDFKSNLELNNYNHRDKDIKGSYGNDPEYELKLKANTGDIKINKK